MNVLEVDVRVADRLRSNNK